MPQRVFSVLIADDDENDRLLLETAFRSALGALGAVHSVDDGEECIRYLAGDGEFHDRSVYPFPVLIILDLQMPKVDGLGVLEFLRHNPAWSVIPRVVLSSSDDSDDIKKAFLVGTSAFHTKPCSGQELASLIQTMVSYWRTCKLPPVDEHGRLLMTQSRGKVGERIPQPRGGESMERLPET